MPSHKNPVLSGFNPDPSIVRVGEDFFLVTSTFEYFPGLPIYHSKDVTQWTLIGHALTRRSQLEMRTAEPGSGVWAPTIRFHKGKFYIATCSFTAYTPQQKVSDHPRTLQVLCYGQDMKPIKKNTASNLAERLLRLDNGYMAQGELVRSNLLWPTRVWSRCQSCRVSTSSIFHNSLTLTSFFGMMMRRCISRHVTEQLITIHRAPLKASQST